jgi:hypothetical protein
MIALGDALLSPARRALGEGGFALHAQHAALSAPHFGADAIPVGAAALARHRLTGRLEGATRQRERLAEANRPPERFFCRRDLSIDQARPMGAVGP